MAVGPFPPYTLPSASGHSHRREWEFGFGPVPDWAGLVVKDACMANLGRKTKRMMRAWLLRYFSSRYRSKLRGMDYVKSSVPRAWNRVTRVSVESGMVEVAWYDDGGTLKVRIPREALVPSTLTLLSVHEC